MAYIQAKLKVCQIFRCPTSDLSLTRAFEDFFLNTLLVEWSPEAMTFGPPCHEPRTCQIPFSLDAHGLPIAPELRSGKDYYHFVLDI
ncbi:hypothetical protein CVT26_012132 [Gymnopilus dilepis]|uniref:Uncharacterized protein n=1 Tax=Gymnopilus dilepis TaxID=231916 RepID=A0A409YGP7_9AGAR|nr:hypothetical protein CVT26_012132 [Gymnopilus dilepis]